MKEAEKIFSDKAEFNKWLLELTESEKTLVVEMINEALWQGYNSVLAHNEQMAAYPVSNVRMGEF